MAAVPMLADFAVRLAFGLFVALTLTSWRAVPVRFFRLQTQVALGILVLGAVAKARSSGSSVLLWFLVAAVVASYLATVAWGLGLPPIATVLDVLAALLAGAWIVRASQAADPNDWALMVLTRGVSGILLGATLHSMLLGHHYLVAPSMTIAPLTRSLDLIAAGLAARCVLAGSEHGPPMPRRPGRRGAASRRREFLAIGWGMGIVGAAVSVYLARRTAAIRSTQSATGILYITTISSCSASSRR